VNFTLREATLDDIRAIAHVHIEAWRTAFRHLVPTTTLDSLSCEAQVPLWTDLLSNPQTIALLAEGDGEVVGFCTGRPSPDADCAGMGEIHTLYVLPRVWRHGIGGSLIGAVEERLRARGFTALSLWVLEDNAIARAFYEARGYRPEGARKIITIGGEELLHCRYERRI